MSLMFVGLSTEVVRVRKYGEPAYSGGVRGKRGILRVCSPKVPFESFMCAISGFYEGRFSDLAHIRRRHQDVKNSMLHTLSAASLLELTFINRTIRENRPSLDTDT